MNRFTKLVTPVALWMAFLWYVPVEANQAHSKKAERYSSVVIEFAKASADVTPDMKTKLTKIVSEARTATGVNEVFVAAWADEARVGDKSLPEGAEDLAGLRAKNVEAYLEDELKVDDVDTFNMAKGTNIWDNLMSNEASRVKGKKPAGSDRVARLIQNEGKPSSVVVVVEAKSAAGD